jgi:hypothetical protein
LERKRMAKVTVTIDIPGVSIADLIKQVVLDDELDCGNNGEHARDTIAPEFVKPHHVLDMFMQTCVAGGGSVGLYGAYITHQEFFEDGGEEIDQDKSRWGDG